MITDGAFLTAKPKNLLASHLQDSEPDEVDIYLGELSSGAARSLEELLSKNEIRPLEASELKQRCLKIVYLTKMTQRNCLYLENLLAKFTKLANQIEAFQHRRDEFPDGFETEPYDLRKRILRTENEAKEIECAVESLEYQIPPLEKEHQLLTKQAALYPDLETITTRRREIEREIDTEVVERQKFNLEARRLHRQIYSGLQCKDQLAVEFAEAQKSISSLTIKLETLMSEPSELKENNARTGLELRHQRAILVDIESQVKELTDNRSILESSNAKVAKESNVLSSENAKLRDRITKVTDALALVKKKRQEFRNEENQLKTSVEKMETNVRSLADKKKLFLESTSQIVKSGGTTRKLIGQGLKKIRNLEETIRYLEGTRKRRKDELEILKKSASKRDSRQREKLMVQVSRLTMKVIAQSECTDRETEQIQQLMNEKIKILSEIDSYKCELSDLHRIFNMKSFEVSQKKQYLRKAQLHLNQVKRDLKLQQSHISYHRKTLFSIQRELASFGKLYKAINVERNECLTLINLAQQKKLMVEEKNSFCENELSILQSALANKQGQLGDAKDQLEGMRKQCISVRDELSKQNQLNREFEPNLNWMSKNIERLKHTLVREEKSVGHVREQLKIAIHKRDQCRGKVDRLQSEIKRNQELVNELECKERKSRDALSAKNRELALLLHKNDTEARSVEVLRWKLLGKRLIMDELNKITDQTTNTRVKLHELEVVADTPTPKNSNNRLRFLEGLDPSLENLMKKEKCLLSNISETESKLQSNQMILNIVDDFLSKLATKKDENREESLQLAKSINSVYRANYKNDLKIKATCAELRMNILYSTVLKKNLEAPRYSTIENRRRNKQNHLILHQDEDNLKFYASKIIPQVTITGAHKFFI